MTNPTTIVLKPAPPLVPMVPTLPIDRSPPIEEVSLNDTIQSSSPSLKVSIVILGCIGIVVLAIILFVFQFRT
jgi:hypothetical protein